MKYRAHGCDSGGQWIENRKSRKSERKIVLAHNAGLHTRRAKKERHLNESQ